MRALNVSLLSTVIPNTAGAGHLQDILLLS